ncbi:hypothetical protein PCURB6_44260 [Paenibacillus curdlanolyticus]|nr:hypothetical protein PCURB6_44260 [Paenibacillus curdlanolyticus]
MRSIVEDSRFLTERDEMMYYFQDKYYKPNETDNFHSPSGKYKLEIQNFYHEEGN